MGIISKKCEKSYRERKRHEMQHYLDIQKGLRESMVNIQKTLNNIDNWDELLNLKEESLEDKQLMKSKTIKTNCYNCLCLFELIGIIFCIIHLIGVQASIIILNSLFSEIVEEFKLWLNNTPREYNFYKRLEINSYRELPEIDVAMITSSVGITLLKSYGFYCINITFQFISSLGFFLIFLLFDFHKDDKLSNNYTPLELLVLILSYIALSFTVGCFSTIAVKEYLHFCSKVFCKCEFENEETTIFYIFSGISGIIIIAINRKIFVSFTDETSKWILMSMSIICFSSFLLSLILHYLYLIPIKNKKKKRKS